MQSSLSIHYLCNLFLFLCTFSLRNTLNALVACILNIDSFGSQLRLFSVLLGITSQEAAANESIPFLFWILYPVGSQLYQKIKMQDSHLRSVLPLSGSLYPQKTQHLFRSGNLPLSSWPKLKARSKNALINLNSCSKRPRSEGSLRINLNSSFISLMQTQMLHNNNVAHRGMPWDQTLLSYHCPCNVVLQFLWKPKWPY